MLTKGVMGRSCWVLKGVQGGDAGGGGHRGHPTPLQTPCPLIHSHIIYKRICASFKGTASEVR